MDTAPYDLVVLACCHGAPDCKEELPFPRNLEESQNFSPLLVVGKVCSPAEEG